MFESLTHRDEDAILILKEDHNKVKDLFEKFEKAESVSEKRAIAADTIEELKIHAQIEEEIFYPAVRRFGGKDLMTEADEEHHVAKVLVAELSMMKGTEEHYDAKYKVLAESVKHHIREEEEKMFPKVRDSGIDFILIGQQLLARKKELKKNGVPKAAEERMVAMSRGQGDSPARAAKANKAPSRKTQSKSRVGRKTKSSRTGNAKASTRGGRVLRMRPKTQKRAQSRSRSQTKRRAGRK